jgi:hypothetical protein
MQQGHEPIGKERGIEDGRFRARGCFDVSRRSGKRHFLQLSSFLISDAWSGACLF